MVWNTAIRRIVDDYGTEWYVLWRTRQNKIVSIHRSSDEAKLADQRLR